MSMTQCQCHYQSVRHVIVTPSSEDPLIASRSFAVHQDSNGRDVHESIVPDVARLETDEGRQRLTCISPNRGNTIYRHPTNPIDTTGRNLSHQSNPCTVETGIL